MTGATRKIAIGCMIGTLTFAGQIHVAQAAERPVAGIDVVLSAFYENEENTKVNIKEFLKTDLISEFKDLGIAQVTNYVNIRKKASEESKIVGKLYNNSAATILGKKGDWYKVKSGTVTGYIKSDFLVTGNKVDKLAPKVGTKIATVNATTLKVREKANLDSKVLTLLPLGEELKVKSEKEDWVNIIYENNNTGYVSADYVDIRTEFEEAISIEEEKARIAQEEAERARQAEEERRNQVRSLSSSSSSRKSSKSSTSTKSSSSKSTKSSSSSSTKSSSSSKSKSSSSLRNDIVSYALRFEGNPYVWGGTSLTKGADCSGFTQSVFKHFGIRIPRNSRSQASSGKRVSLDNMKKGDLIFYSKNGRINHVAIYIGNGKVIGASSRKEGIKIKKYNYRNPVKVVSYLG
ncbi:MAG: SH3 domain-containing protein [Clostridiales bacterium]|nr:SH3 domain-containing protein [Clostridiales bacterium]